MNNKFIKLFLCLVVLSLTAFGCRPQAAEIPVGEQIDLTKDTESDFPPTLPVVETETPQPGGTARFTIQAADIYLEPLTALYQAFFQGELPVFVDEGGDLVVERAAIPESAHPPVPATFLPDADLVARTDAGDVQSFINYAISLEGQKVLVEKGFLPNVLVLTDQAGNTIEISQPVERLISTYGPATAFIYSVDAEDRLVSASYLGARDPMGAAVMEKIDPRFSEILGEEFFTQEDFNVEQAAALNPDLIITSSRTAWLNTAEQLDLSVFLFDAETPERLREAMQLTGQLFGPHSVRQAEVWQAYYDEIFDAVREQTASLPDDERPKVLFTGTVPTRIASGEMYQTDIIEAAGGVSVSTALTGYWNDVNLEQILVWDPDVIIVPPYGGASISAITESPEWQILDAVQAGKVYQMPKLVVPWDTPAPDSVLGIVWLAQLLHPELVSLDCKAEADYFYNTFYNYPVTQDELATICTFQ